MIDSLSLPPSRPPDYTDYTAAAKRPARPAAGLGVALLVAAVVATACPAREAAAAPDARLFAAHALALRAAGVAGKEPAAGVLASMPGAGMAGTSDNLPALWRPFFANAIVKLGRLRTPAPVALYYDPLLDVAVLTLWERRNDGYRVASARALPGERLADVDADAPPAPGWMTAEDGPVAALRRIAAERLDAFRRAHPAEAAEAGRDGATFAAAAADMRAVLPRLAWATALRAQWAGARPVWLGPLLERIDDALAAGDAAAIAAAAPDTGPEAAAALARLPTAFAEALTLDMTLDAAGPDRLAIASTPGDGSVYLLALCRIEGEACALRRLLLVSLGE